VAGWRPFARRARARDAGAGGRCHFPWPPSLCIPATSSPDRWRVPRASDTNRRWGGGKKVRQASQSGWLDRTNDRPARPPYIPSPSTRLRWIIAASAGHCASRQPDAPPPPASRENRLECWAAREIIAILIRQMGVASITSLVAHLFLRARYDAPVSLGIWSTSLIIPLIAIPYTYANSY
jgi:hypothetical protein